MADKKNDLKKWEPEFRPLASGEILHAPPDSLAPGEAVEAYAVVKWLADTTEKRREELRKRVLSDPKIIEHGKKTDSGGTVTSVRGNKVQRRRQVARFGNLSRIRQLLHAKGLEEKEVFDTVVVREEKQVVNPSKIERLVSLGQFTDEEIDSMHQEKWILVVDPSDSIKSLLEEADNRASEQRKVLFGETSDDPGNDL